MIAEVRLRSGAGYNTVTVLPTVGNLQFDAKDGDVGAITFTMPQADALALGMGAESVVEVRPNCQQGQNLWYGLDGSQLSTVEDGAVYIQFSGKSIVNWLTDCIVYPSTWPTVPTQNPDGTTATVIQGHSFENATPGTILQTLITRGVNRGGLAWLDASTFTGTTTSDGQAWGTTLTTTYSNGTTLLAVLQDLAARNMISFRMDQMALKVFNYDSQAVHFTVDQLMLRRGKQVTEQTRTTDASDAGTVILGIGDESAIKESADNPALDTLIGRRREKFASYGGITDLSTLQTLVNAELSVSGHPQVEDVFGISDNDKLPWIDFQVGDWVWVDFDGTLKNLKIQQMAAAQQAGNNLLIGLTVGDIISSRDEKNQLLINNTIGANGYGALVVQQDKKPPNNPSNVVASPVAYRDSNGHDLVKMTITWTSPTTNSDGSTMHDLDHFDTQYKVDGSTTWTPAAPVPATSAPLAAFISSLPAGKSFVSQVRAVDTAGNASTWAAQTNTINAMPKTTTPPNPGSQSVITPGIQSVKIAWDGKDNTGTLVDVAVSYAQVHLSTTAGFTPTLATQVGTLSDAGTVTVSGLSSANTYYSKIVIVDKSDNVSSVSVVSTGVSPVLVQTTDVNFTARQIGSVTTFTQGTTPTGAIAGDLWIDTANGNTIKIYTGSVWTPYQFAAAAIIATARQLGGITTYVQTTTPTGALAGDLWIDTTSGNNLLKQYNGTVWAAYAPAAGTLTGTVSAAQVSFTARDILGITTFVQGTTPVGAIAGDLWIDTSNGNVLKRYSGAAWVTNQVGDAAISGVSGTKLTSGTVPATAVNFTARSISGITTFTQGTTPVGAITNDLWIDTSNGNVLKTYNGASWVTNQVGTAAVATGAITSNEIANATIVGADIANATIAAANVSFTARSIGGITTFTQGTTPVGAVTNDLWIDTSNGNVIKTYNGAAWVTNTLTGILSSQITATARQLGGIITYVQGTTPTGMLSGDLWIDTANGNMIKQYNGTVWGSYQVGTAAIATGAVTGTLIAGTTITAANIVNGTITGAKIAASTIASTNVNFTARTIGSTTTFQQSTTPTGALAGDLWIDTSTSANIIKVYTGSVWTPYSFASPAYVQSRGENLVTNGTGLLGDNTNFSTWTFDPVNTFAGGGSFKTSTFSGTMFSDELIPVDTSQTYKLNLYANSTVHAVGSHEYFGVALYDIDGNSIAPNMANKIPGSTDTTLASALTIGDTVVHLTNATGWDNTATANKYFVWWPYTNAKGYSLPNYTYSRNVSAAGLWGAGAVVGNDITLTNPWAGPNLPSGTPIRNGQSGGGFKYIAAANIDVPNAWTNYSGLIGTLDLTGNVGVLNTFWQGTAYLKFLALVNRDVAGNTTNVSNVSLTNFTAANLPEIATAQAAASAAQTTANGKNTIYRQGTTPSGSFTTDDLWFDTANGNRLSTWTGAAWTVNQLQGVAVGNLDAGSITTGSLASARIAAGTITGTQIAGVTITAANIVSGTITGTQIAATTISAGNIVSGTITGTQIAATTIAAGNIVSGTITSSQIAAGTIQASNILAGTITGTQIAATTIAAANIVTGTITATQIAAGTITGTNIAATGTITGAMIAATTISASNIVSATITTTQIAAGTIVAGNIAANTITAGQIAATTITAAQIAANTITAAQIAANTITAAQIAAGTITAVLIAAGTITAEKLTVAARGQGLALNPSFEDPGTVYTTAISNWNLGDLTAGTFAVTRVVDTTRATQGTAMASLAVTAAPTTSCASIQSDAIPAQAGVVYYVRFVYGASVTTSRGLYVRIKAYKADGTSISQTDISTNLPMTSSATNNQVIEGQYTAPALTAYLRLFAYNYQPNVISTLFVDSYDIQPVIVSAVIANGAVTATQIAANTITASQIAANTITAAQIAANTITAAQIAANTITASQIAAGTITTNEIAANTITAADILAGTITTTEIAAHTILAADIVAGTITGVEIAATTIAAGNIVSGTITTSQIASGTIVAGNIQAGTITGTQIAATTIAAANIVAGTITSSQIAAGTIVAGNIVSGTITGTQIAAATISASNIVANTITAGQLAAGSVTAASILAGTITGTQIAATTIAAGNIVSGTITATQIAAGTITATQIAANTITAAKIAASTITATEMAVNSITAESLTLGVKGQGISQNPSYEDAAKAGATIAAGWTNSTTGAGSTVARTVDTVKSTHGSTMMFMTPGGTGVGFSTSVTSDFIAVSANTVYYVMGVWGASGNSTNGLYLGVSWYTPAQVLISTSYIVNNGVMSTRTKTDQLSSGQITAPATAAFARLVGMNDKPATAVTLWLDYLDLQPVALTGTIAAGAITANEIAATTIVAGNIASGTITTTQIAAGTITATNIAAGAITATMIATGTLSSTVTLSGSIKTAASGARVEMSSSGIQAFDSSNTQTALLSSADGSVTINRGKITTGVYPNPVVSLTESAGIGQLIVDLNGTYVRQSTLASQITNVATASEVGHITLTAPVNTDIAQAAASNTLTMYSGSKDLTWSPLTTLSATNADGTHSVMLQMDASTSPNAQLTAYAPSGVSAGITITPTNVQLGTAAGGTVSILSTLDLSSAPVTLAATGTTFSGGLLKAANGISVIGGTFAVTSTSAFTGAVAANGGLTSTTIGATGLITATTITASGLITANAGVSSTSLSASTTLSVGTTSTFTGTITAAAITASGTITANNGVTIPSGKTLAANGGLTSTTIGATGLITATTITASGLITANNGVTIPSGKTLAANGGLTSTTIGATGLITATTITASGLITANAGVSSTTLAASSTSSFTGLMTAGAITASGTVTTNGALNTAAITASGTVTANGAVVATSTVQHGSATAGSHYYEEWNLASQTLTTGTLTTITGMTAGASENDFGGTPMTLASGTWTCPGTGVYEVAFSFSFAAFTNSSRLESGITLNGTALASTAIAWHDITSAPSGANGADMITARKKLTTGDTLNFRILQGTGGNASIIACPASYISIMRCI